MRNLLAFVAAAALTVAIAGWYLNWYSVKSEPGTAGHQTLNIDINKGKIADDVHRGVQKGEERLQDVLDRQTGRGTTDRQPTQAPGLRP